MQVVRKQYFNKKDKEVSQVTHDWSLMDDENRYRPQDVEISSDDELSTGKRPSLMSPETPKEKTAVDVPNAVDNASD